METRTFAGPIELRADGDGRTLVGTVVPWNVETRVGHLVESFARGSIDTARPLVLTATHPRDGNDLPIGRSTVLDDRPAGLWGEFRIADTAAGNDVLGLVRDGVPLGLSIGFRPLPGGDRWTQNRTRVERLRVDSDHVAVIRVPAYPGAMVAAVRAAGPPYRPMFAVALRR